MLLAALNGTTTHDLDYVLRGRDTARMLKANLTEGEDKVIHIAVTAKRNAPFIEKLLDLMRRERLMDLQNFHGDTCLSIAAVSGDM